MKYVRALFFILSIAALQAQSIPLNSTPNHVIGQDTIALNNLNPNLVEGKEFYRPQGLALDTTTNPPGLYVADTLNNRVLGFRNAAQFSNGAPADIVIGQPDFLTTTPEGPNRQGSNFQTGLSTPVGLAVDAHGNLYVVDAGNNRVLRFPTPFSKTTQLPDLVIGQPGFDTRGENTNGPSAASLNFAIVSPTSPAGTAYAAGLTFDAAGNLWVADPLNNRVLRFPAAALGSNATNGPSADVVLGQSSFTATAGGSTDPGNLSVLNVPSSVAVDSAGRLFVLESNASVRGRVLVFTPPFSIGQAATRELGYSTALPAPPVVSDSQFGDGPGAVFIYGNDGVGVSDTQNNRILLFKPVSQWTTDRFTQHAVAVVGQPDFTSNLANRGFGETGADRLQGPSAAAYAGGELYVADTGNNRVVVFMLNTTNFGLSVSPASRVLGQNAMNFNAPNLVEGRELDFTTYSANGLAGDGGLAIDTQSTPAHLYIADTYNNRVLGYKDFRSIQNGAKADLVIGQADLVHTMVNAPGGSPTAPTLTGLNQPVAVAVDASGNLYVADRGNGRVLRYPAPFSNPAPATPNLVLGQSNFTRLITDPSPATMAAPSGLAFASDGSLLVSDSQLNRVLYFPGPNTKFTSGMAATKVFGQSNFTGTAAGSADDRLNTPAGISIDSSDRLYIADFGNNRVSIYDRVTQAGPDPHQALALGGLKNPHGVFVSPGSEIFVADTGNNQVERFPNYESLAAVNYAPSAVYPDYSPLGVAVDSFGNLYIADMANRVLIFYRTLALTNGANFLQEPYGPGTFLSIFGAPGQFGGDTQVFSTIPVPTSLANLQVLVNGKAAPVYYVSPTQINFLLPMSTPTSGTADVQVVQNDTGQVLGDSTINLNVASPGLFTTGGGSGQVAALNQDNTVNGPDNPAPVGSVLQIFGTGQGFVPNAPPDGTPPSGPTPSQASPAVLMYQSFVPAANVQYSGLAPSLVGVWQINVLVPASAVPADKSPAQVPCVVLLNSIPSGGAILGRTTTIWVKR